MTSPRVAPKLLLVRHFPTLWNEQGLYQGKTDIPLSPQSLADFSLKQVRQPYADWKLYSSPLLRARQSAETLFHRPPTIVSEATELDFGQWEGQAIEEVQRHLPTVQDPFGWRGLDFKAPGGESSLEAQHRFAKWLRFFHTQGQDAVLFTHKGLMLAILAQAWDWPMDRKRPHKVNYESGQLLSIENPEKPVVLQLNVEFYSK